MSPEVKALKQSADEARLLYKQNLITRDECRASVEPYINAYNEKANEIAKKYGQSPRYIRFISYIR